VTRTRVRRRRLTLTISLALVAAAWAGPAVRALGSPETPARVSRTSYVVRQGDTLWTIARELAPGSDPRPVVDLLSAMNGVDPGRLVPGQTLVVSAL
jgi:Tfp pilus assembly protein FimV